MAACCDPRGCDRVFDSRYARRTAARYRRRGLDRTARWMVEQVTQHGVQGATVLEIGGGVGAIQLELLKRGAVATTNLELSPAYDAEARRLLDDAGLSGRVTRRILDIVADPAAVAQADIVVLHRVVCCYPDYAALLAQVAAHARRHVVFSYPPANAVTRALVAVQHLSGRLTGREFRAFAHSPAAMSASLTRHGLRAGPARRGALWRAAFFSR